jgi:hypothetical protein
MSNASFLCTLCGRSLATSEFSKTQLRKHEQQPDAKSTMKCTACVLKSTAALGTHTQFTTGLRHLYKLTKDHHTWHRNYKSLPKVVPGLLYQSGGGGGGGGLDGGSSSPRLLGLDCETISVVGNDRCLARVSLVEYVGLEEEEEEEADDAQHPDQRRLRVKVLLDAHVRPSHGTVLAFGVSGVTADDLATATLASPRDAVRRLAALIGAADFIVGHALYHDFAYLQVCGVWCAACRPEY